MKKIIYLITIMSLLISCSDMLVENPKAIATETFYNTAEEIASATNAIYSPLRARECMGGVYPALMESMPDYGYAKGSYTVVTEYQKLDANNIARITDIWTDFYLSIRNANLVIENVPNSPETTESEKAQFIGEAKFLRALNYFFLVRSWGGVPLRTEENMEELDVERSSVDDVYDLILSDLEYAEESLPDQPRLIGAPSKWAAKTLLAHVYLTLEDWENALNLAGEVIESGQYSLVKVSDPEYFDNIFGPDIITTSEEIFYFKYTRGTKTEGWWFPLFSHASASGYHGGGGYSAIYTTTDNLIYKNWDDNDFRKQNNFYNWDIGLGSNTILYKKYSDPDAVTQYSGNDNPLYRYADLLFIYAEAANKVKNGPTAESMECVNKIHRRAYGYDPEVFSPIDFKIEDYNADTFFDLIIKERGYETCYEGKRWLELVRTGKATEIIKEVKGIDITESFYLWPIPSTEYNYNKAIDPIADQNPGY